MTAKMHIRDKQADTSKGEPEILERLSVDAHEIVKNDPERFEIVGRVQQVAPGGAGSTTAVLDNDPPKEVARKVLAAAGIEQPVPEGVSDETADEDLHGNPTPEAEAKKAEAKSAKGKGAKGKGKNAPAKDESAETGEEEE